MIISIDGFAKNGKYITEMRLHKGAETMITDILEELEAGGMVRVATATAETAFTTKWKRPSGEKIFTGRHVLDVIARGFALATSSHDRPPLVEITELGRSYLAGHRQMQVA